MKIQKPLSSFGFIFGIAAVSALTLSSCTPSPDPTPTATASETAAVVAITVGTTDKVTALDPAGPYDSGSFDVMNQVYPFLLNSKQGSAEVEPDIAVSAQYTTPTEYTVKLKSNLTFANGNELTSSDVKFSFDRVVAIQDERGPASLLENLISVTAPDDETVIFNLRNGNDQTWPQILSSPAAAIVDEEVFSPTELTPDDEIVQGKPFAGQYEITAYTINESIAYTPFAGYQGALGEPQNDSVTVKYYDNDSELKLAIDNNEIDVAHRLFVANLEDAMTNDKVNVIEGPSGETRSLVFNFDTMPFGAKAPDADPVKAQAVRQALASLIDREALAQDVYMETFLPLYSVIPESLPGATQPLKALYGDGQGDPSVEKAKQTLTAAGITEPVPLTVQYNSDSYGLSSDAEYAALQTQLETGGLFVVTVQPVEWATYVAERAKGSYPAYQFAWLPSYADADNYLSSLFVKGNLLMNNFTDADVEALIGKQKTETDPTARAEQLAQIQDILATELSTLPLLQGKQIAVVGAGVEGVVLDESFKFRYASLTK